MTNLLLRLLIRDYKNTRDSKVREQYGKLSGAVGIASNLLLFAFKLAAGLLSGSISILADAVNNLSDSASSIVTLVGFKLAGKPADDEHPYGHARIEYISGLIVSFLILFLGLQLLQSSVDKILHPEQAEFSFIVAGVLVVSILLKIWQGFFYKRLGAAIDSPTLSATAADSLNDVFSTSAVLLGLLITKATGFNLDGYMGVVVALFIVVTGVRVIRETSSPLLGTAPTRELVDQIYDKILQYDGILGLHDLSVHTYGAGRCFASVHCEVSASENILVSHDLIDNIERDFLRDLKIHLVIHLDPVVTDDERTNALKQQVLQVLQQISPEISMHDFRVVWGETHSNLIFDVCVSFRFPMSDAELMQSIEREVQKLDSRYYTVVTVDHDYVPVK